VGSRIPAFCFAYIIYLGIIIDMHCTFMYPYVFLSHDKDKHFGSCESCLLSRQPVWEDAHIVEKERRRSARYRIHGHGSISFGGDDIRGSGQIYNCLLPAVQLDHHVTCHLDHNCASPCNSVQLTSHHRYSNRSVDSQYKFGVEFLLADATEVSKLGARLEGLPQSNRIES
jgi:hypothetical protein